MDTVRTFGCKRDTPDDRDLLFRFHRKMLTTLPNSASTLVPFLPPKADQMSLSCCTGIGSTRAAKAFLNFIKYKWPHMPSALFLYLQARLAEGTPITVDDGAMIRTIFKTWNDSGVCPEDSNVRWSWPWAATGDHWKTMPPKECFDNAARHKIEYMRLSEDPDEIKSALVQGHPVVIGIDVPESMMSEKTAANGLITRSNHSLGGHCMWLHSYDHDFAIGSNSWGANWGAEVAGSRGNFLAKFSDLSDPSFCIDRWAIVGYS